MFFNPFQRRSKRSPVQLPATRPFRSDIPRSSRRHVIDQPQPANLRSLRLRNTPRVYIPRLGWNIGTYVFEGKEGCPDSKR